MVIESEKNQRVIGRCAWAAAWAGLVVGQLHALARHRTEDGRSDLELPLTRIWAEPAADALSPLLTWGSPDAVYLTYGKLWLPLFVAFTLCAFVVRRRRQPVGFERWAWRAVLTGYVGACVGVAVEFWTQGTTINDALLGAAFVVVMPFMLLTLIGSTVLGVTLLRRGVRLPAVLLVLAVPGFVVLSEVTSLGNVVLPVLFGFGVFGRQLARGTEERLDARRAPAPSPAA
jgi:hypothetical protein